MGFDTAAIRAQFPVLQRRIDGIDGPLPLTFMDHGASTHAPQPVLDAVMDLHGQHYANIHRGNHTLSIESTDLFDDAVEDFAHFIGAKPDHGAFIMGSNTTDSLSLAAHVMADEPGATLTTLQEHHSNDLPHRDRGDVIHTAIDGYGRVDMEDFEAKLEENQVKLVAVSGCSNVTGYFPPIHDMARLAHDHGARILVDAAQLYAHKPIDVRPEGHPEHIDFLAAAGHKAYAPFGSSFLYGPEELFNAAPPYTPGGGTVDWVTDMGAWYTRSPDRHMGGTPNITGVIAFAAATRWLADIGMDNVRAHEVELLERGLAQFQRLREEHDVVVWGPPNAEEKAGVFSFIIPHVHHELVSKVLSNEFGVATRNGCFCAHPLLHRLMQLGDTSYWTDALGRGEDVPLPGATRGTIGIYNTAEDSDLLIHGIETVATQSWRGTYDHTVDTFGRPLAA